ncbi:MULTISPECIES: hypothetical protein [Burkholderiaceae]|uniref:hypothetical protein n=1 Tax=Burkholderiaceae TaxID=119060 RepID=UPI002231CC27|nr:hypothetical protein [Burkholderia cenocepacia]CAJ5017328.1 Uncharacterised protein [Burkholderia pseudomallei]MCW3502072.1 hypothetical protein [Burkholderia cenocepacia]MCW3509458.1 hypothetical protein [Burkholderia cenocepacia]MCW3517155.1 hypothetical protein [Burkholderia cenocepacia]MCW3532640.1 hypothetical protein [Burkholderia cenocepacia]
MNLNMFSNDTTAIFEMGSDDFVLTPAASKARVAGRAIRFTVSKEQSSVSLSIAPKALEKEAQTARLNQALALGYMPALRKTST